MWTYDGSLERHYLQGERRGTEVEVTAGGERREREYMHGERHAGTWTYQVDGRVRTSVDILAGEATAISLPEARLPAMAPAAPSFSPIDGAFGIELGNELAQFRGLRCRPWSRGFFVAEFADGPEQGCFGLIGRDLIRGGSVVRVSNPPNPVSGARAHVAVVDSHVGVAESWVYMSPSGPMQEADMKEEGERVDQLLKSRYGTECVDESLGKPWRRTGQCDVRGLLARYAVAHVRSRGIAIQYEARSLSEVDGVAQRLEVDGRREREVARPLQLDDLRAIDFLGSTLPRWRLRRRRPAGASRRP